MYRSNENLTKHYSSQDRMQHITTASTAAKTLDSQKATPRKVEEEKKTYNNNTSGRKPTSGLYSSKDYGIIPGANDTKNFSRPPKASEKPPISTR